MSNPNEVRDFIWVEPHHGDYVMLSRAAGMLALHAAAASMRRNTPGFIPDEGSAARSGDSFGHAA